MTGSRVRVGRSTIGRGVFAARVLRRGETIGEVTGRLEPSRDVPEDHFDLDGRSILIPDAPFRFLNHSCAPNAAVVMTGGGRRPPRLWVETLRALKPGDEVTIDYGFSAEYAIPCRCGAARCRGWVVAEEELARVIARRRRA